LLLVDSYFFIVSYLMASYL